MEEKINIIDKLMNMKKYEEAIEYLNSIREDLENDVEYYYRLSKIYEELEFYEEAIEKLEQILESDDKVGEAYFKIANIYQKLGNLDNCYEYLNKALKYGFDSSKIFFYRGLIHEVKEDYDEALSFYNKANIKNKGYMDPRYRKYYIYKLLENDDLIEKSLNEIVENDSLAYKGYRLLFQFLISKKRYKDSLMLLKRAQVIFKDLDELNLDLIKIYIKLTKYEKAEEIIKNIDENSNNYSRFQVEYSKIEAIYKNYYIARSILEKPAVYNEENPELLYLLGVYNIKIRDFKNGCKYLNKLSILDSKDILVRVGNYLNACSYRFIEDKELSEIKFKNLYRFYREESLKDSYDISLIVLKVLTLLEIEDYKEINEIIAGLSENEFEEGFKVIKVINKIMAAKKNGTFNGIELVLTLKAIWSKE